MSKRIAQCFARAKAQNQKVLVPFITAGDPSPDLTVQLMHSLVRGGAGIIELGVPFSDPMADGPVIQEASERAIEKGVSLQHVIDWVSEFRLSDDVTPVILMGYLNPVERFGHTELAQAAQKAGVDGLLLVDCPPGELPELQNALTDADIAMIRLVAPTTSPTRLKLITRDAAGFIYYVSFRGTTGAGILDTGALAGPLSEIRQHSTLPLAVGFGIKDADSASAVAEHADAVVIGSALVSQLAGCADDEQALKLAVSFMTEISAALAK